MKTIFRVCWVVTEIQNIDYKNNVLYKEGDIYAQELDDCQFALTICKMEETVEGKSLPIGKVVRGYSLLKDTSNINDPVVVTYGLIAHFDDLD